MMLKATIVGFVGVASIAVGTLAVADSASDKEITRQVRAAIAQHSEFGVHIHARTKNGVVYFTGRASTPLVKENLDGLTQGVAGVKRVVNKVYFSN
jgi:osmotically-inducible protein OsmY